jgi:hypothetical protein
MRSKVSVGDMNRGDQLDGTDRIISAISEKRRSASFDTLTSICKWMAVTSAHAKEAGKASIGTDVELDVPGSGLHQQVDHLLKERDRLMRRLVGERRPGASSRVSLRLGRAAT